MEKPFSYEEASQQERHFLITVACQGNTTIPVYSGDIAVAFQLPHRFLREVIENHYRELQRAYGTQVHLVRHKKRGCTRAMHGYILPLKAVMQLLTVIEGDLPPLKDFYTDPCVLYTCLAGENNFCASLN